MPGRIPRPLAVLLFALLAVHLFLLSWFKVISVDTWWHMKQGALYVATRSLPAADPFAFTTAGHEWIKFSWVTDILFYAVYSVWGATGLVLLRMAVCALITLLLYRLLRRCGVHPLVAIVLVFVASLAMRFRLFVRPEIFSFAFLVLNVGILLRLRDGRPGSPTRCCRSRSCGPMFMPVSSSASWGQRSRWAPTSSPGLA